MYSLIVLEVRSTKSGGWQGRAPNDAARKQCVPASSSLWWPQGVLG